MRHRCSAALCEVAKDATKLHQDKAATAECIVERLEPLPMITSSPSSLRYAAAFIAQALPENGHAATMGRDEFRCA